MFELPTDPGPAYWLYPHKMRYFVQRRSHINEAVGDVAAPPKLAPTISAVEQRRVGETLIGFPIEEDVKLNRQLLF